MATGSTDLQQMLADLDVVVRDEPYVFLSVDPGLPAPDGVAATVVEEEGVTLVLPRHVAQSLGAATTPAFAWLTLTVHSSLEAVGLTAAFSAALAAAGISCNVLAGYHHDHLLVALDARDEAVRVLRGLRRRGA